MLDIAVVDPLIVFLKAGISIEVSKTVHGRSLLADNSD